MRAEDELRRRYKCTASDNGGWCNGTKRGSRMRCPKHGLTQSRERICILGIDKDFDEMMKEID